MAEVADQPRWGTVPSAVGGLSVEGLAGSVPVGVFILDGDHRVTLWNPAVEGLLGWPADRVLGGSLPFYAEGRAADRDRQRFRTLLEGEGEGSSVPREVVRRHRDGTLVDVFQSVVPLWDEGGDTVGLVGFVWPVGERDDAERALRESERRFRRIFEASNDGIVIIDPVGDRYLAVNPGACQMLGYSADELMAIAPTSVHPGQVDKLKAIVEQVLDTDQGLTEEVRCKTKSGVLIPVELSLSPFRFDDQPRVLAITRDISERKQAQTALTEIAAQLTQRAEELERANTKLEAVNDELSEFAYAVSHDLAEPLRMVSSYAQLLDRRYGSRLNTDAEEFLGFAIEGVQRMQAVIAGLQTYLLVGTGDQIKQRLDSHQVLKSALVDLEDLQEATAARIELGELPQIWGHPTELEELFRSLLSNALIYHQPDQPPQVSVTAQQTPDGWRYAVTDNGIGVDPRYHDQIFTMFKRLHTWRDYPGAGIGLAIAQKIIQNHHGQIWIESQPQQGATIYLTLPEPTTPTTPPPP